MTPDDLNDEIEFEALAVKQALVSQIAEAMKAQNLSRKRLAERMKTSRSQISRLLDPKDGNVTLTTLQRAANICSSNLRLVEGRDRAVLKD